MTEQVRADVILTTVQCVLSSLRYSALSLLLLLASVTSSLWKTSLWGAEQDDDRFLRLENNFVVYPTYIYIR